VVSPDEVSPDDPTDKAKNHSIYHHFTRFIEGLFDFKNMVIA
jgi:hypothetical protein